MDLVHITTHVADAQGHLRGQFKRPNVLALTEAMVSPVQDAEDAAFAVAGGRFLDTATGATLDKIAASKNVLRFSMDDDQLRVVVRGAIGAQFTETTLAQTRGVAQQLFIGTHVFLKQPDNVDVSSAGRSACVAVGIGGSTLPADARAQSVAIMQSALPAGVVLERVFLFPAVALAVQMAPGYPINSPWVAGLGVGGLGETIYQNPVA